jgi:hypothetical protein
LNAQKHGIGCFPRKRWNVLTTRFEVNKKHLGFLRLLFHTISMNSSNFMTWINRVLQQTQHPKPNSKTRSGGCGVALDFRRTQQQLQQAVGVNALR